MNNDFIFKNGDEYLCLITFKSEEISKISEIALEDFGPFLSNEQWESVLFDGSVILYSNRDKRANYLLQLACADIVAPIRKQFMSVYVKIESFY
jgi:hypothetical protein